MANSRFYSSIAAATNLQVTAAPSDTSIQVASSSGFPGSFPFTLSLDYGSANEELVDVTAGGPNVFTVTRAVDGTSASTHNAGAVVRHVTSARDFTDSRTHEAATSTVHGVTGALVGATQVQTLTNKTLTNPTINAAALSGNLTGTPTFTGALTFSGGPIFNTGPALFQNTTPTAQVQRIGVPSDTQDRHNVDANGKHSWGSGAIAPDTNLYRSNADTLQTDDSFVQLGENRSIRTGASDISYRAGVGGDAFSRYTVAADGTQNWGTGAAATDVTMGRAAVGKLGITGDLAVSGTITATTSTVTGTAGVGNLNVTNQTFTTFTPNWSGIGTATFTRNFGAYAKFGKLVWFQIYTQWATDGSGSSGISVSFPTEPFRAGTGANTTRQVVIGGITLSNSGVVDGPTEMFAFAGDTGTQSATLRRFDGLNITGSNMVTGSIFTIDGWYREV